MAMAKPSEWLNLERVGYVVNAGFSDENSLILDNLNSDLQTEYGDAVFSAPRHTLHITLMDWITPGYVQNGEDKDELFDDIEARYSDSLNNALKNIGKISVRFSQIRVDPSTIIILGQDDGQFQQIREKFVKNLDLIPDTKPIPNIIHSSLARFAKPIELERVESFIDSNKIDFTQNISEFRLVRSSKQPILDFEVVKLFKL